MKDILGREIKVGDIVAHGTRSGNGGAISVKIIADSKMAKNRWSDNEFEKLKVINFYINDRKWDEEKREWYAVEPTYEKGGSGWSEGGTFLIVNESVPEDIATFLRSLI